MSISGLDFKEIVRMYQQPLYWYIRKVVIIHEDAEDILQETFMKAYVRLWQLRSENALKGWLFTIATNEIRRYYRTHRDTVNIMELGNLEVSDTSSVSDSQVSRIISGAVADMTPLQREVFCLRYYEGMDYDAIAKITGSGKNTLMVSYHEAMKKIKKEIGK